MYLNQALRCIGDLIATHPKNLDAISSKVLGEESQVEPALNSILRIILRTSSMPEFIAADHVFKSFCEVGTLYSFMYSIVFLLPSLKCFIFACSLESSIH